MDPHMSSTASPVRFTMLNAMAGREIEVSLHQLDLWGIKHLDLKDQLFGRKVEELEPDDAKQIRRMADEHGQQAYCLSSSVMVNSIDELQSPLMAEKVLGSVSSLISTAEILQPKFIRLLSASVSNPVQRQQHRAQSSLLDPLFELYRRAVDKISDAGFTPTIENEASNCLMATPDDVEIFFHRLDRSDQVVFTWDVQNFWQMGTYPSLEIYHRLRPLIGFYHVKGGRAEPGSHELKWRSTLEQASWPVLEISRAVQEDGVSPVICLNPSHGKSHPDYSLDRAAEKDLAFLREHLAMERR
jgi:hypothetical protein